MQQSVRTTSKRSPRAVLLATVAAMAAALAAPSAASAVDFNPGPGTYNVNTTDLTLTGPFTNQVGEDQAGIAVFSFDNVNIPDGAVLIVDGSRPFRLQASGNLILAGDIDGAGTNSIDFNSTPFAGGPGGGRGGVNLAQPGQGPGGGGSPSSGANGAGGGGFGGVGARGGVSAGDPGTGGPGGTPYGDLNVKLQGGSGGGGGSASSPVGGGGGGGGIALQAGDTLTVTDTAVVNVNGGDGAVGGNGASGGGSGGGIIARGETINITGQLLAKGGQGGAGGCCGDGGGGGGGRIAYQFRTLVAAGTADAAGGTSGTKTTGGCCGHGGLSPDVTGANGVVSQTPAPTAVTGAATAVDQTVATVNGTSNPNGNTTTFHFEYGTTTAYGGRSPIATDASVGSDSTARGVSQNLVGLAAGTTYHYRLVVTNALGFVTRGADATFTTAAPASDADKDGVPVPQDCNDNNPGIRPGAIDVPGNGVDEDCAGGDANKRIGSFLTYDYSFAGKRTVFTRLDAEKLPAGSTVVVKCKSKAKGCPFKSKKITVKKATKRLKLVKYLKKRKKLARLKKGAVISVFMTAKNQIGALATVTVGKSHKKPKYRLRCLAVGTTKVTTCPS